MVGCLGHHPKKAVRLEFGDPFAVLHLWDWSSQSTTWRGSYPKFFATDEIESNILTQRLGMGPAELLAQAEELLRTGRADEALPIATKALAGLQPDGSRVARGSLPALNLLGEINLEIGDADTARQYFLTAVNLDSDGSILESQGGGAEKFLWLAQLSEEGGQDSVNWFRRGATVLRNDIAAIGDVEAGKEKRKKLSEALCGIIEVCIPNFHRNPSV